MEVFINRTPVAIDAETTLAELLAREGIAPEGTAVAIDNKVVPRTAWNTTRLQEGAKLTVIRAVCGG
jgi:sulfur carrier protein